MERRIRKSYTDKDGVYHEGLEDELARLEAEESSRGTSETLSSSEERMGESQGKANQDEDSRARFGISGAEAIRSELNRRDKKREALRKKYNISDKGDISLDDLSRMFRDLNSSRKLGKLFDKVYNVLKNLGVDFRFTDALDGLSNAEASAFGNFTFYSWDAMTQGKRRENVTVEQLLKE